MIGQFRALFALLLLLFVTVPAEADGGLVSYGVGGALIRPLDRRRSVTLFGGVDRLGGEPAGTSLIRERGQRMQFTVGLGYGMRFGL